MAPCGSSTETRMTSRGFGGRHHADERGDVAAGRVAAARVGLLRGAGLARDLVARDAASVPVPSRTTFFSIAFSSAATVAREMRPCDFGRRLAAEMVDEMRLAPDAAVRDRGVRGGHLHGVTATPWPIGMLPIVEPDHVLGRRRMPGLSPGKPSPVCAPKPNCGSSA